ncbi:ketopantoate reductase family protein [Bacillus sp. FJAT-45037]|uniref:ketopantoate reductase family protein n=1 Tax=Bacillus sp. FJAT-45037 TaxID=2011007 RepID=UPI000C248508|nr:ketopantoate reductase family protein [Bacillus sp. FJAT-45037]
MKFLIVGAGAVGGYFGGRLLEKGEDVTFLVRYKRQEQLLDQGLLIESIHGDFRSIPKTIVEGEKGQFDVIMIGTKSYHLEQAIEAVKPFLHEKTVVIPMLNGFAHLNILKQAFRQDKILGGLCFIESTVTEEGLIQQTSKVHQFMFGEFDGTYSERVQKIEQAFSNTNAMIKVSDSILQEMWHKYLFITTMSGVTSLFKQPVGPIRELAEGKATIKALLKEIATIMRAEGAPLAEGIEEIQYERFLSLEAGMKSSMQRDMEKRGLVEVDHLQGYLLEKAADHRLKAPILTTVYVNLKLYEKQLHEEKRWSLL